MRIDCLQYTHWSEKIVRKTPEGGIDAIHTDEGARLPGDGRAIIKRLARVDGVPVNVATHERIEVING